MAGLSRRKPEAKASSEMVEEELNELRSNETKAQAKTIAQGYRKGQITKQNRQMIESTATSVFHIVPRP
jgi:uncharacterized protein YdgA (DUF945 family)